MTTPDIERRWTRAELNELSRDAATVSRQVIDAEVRARGIRWVDIGWSLDRNVYFFKGWVAKPTDPRATPLKREPFAYRSGAR